MRIISFIPTGTEIVGALGLAEYLVAVTHACANPGRTMKPRITRHRRRSDDPLYEDALATRYWDTTGPIFTIDHDLLQDLRPNIILTSPPNGTGAVRYCDLLDAVATLPPPQPKVVDVQPGSIEELLHSIRDVGAATGSHSEADCLCDDLWTRTEYVRASVAEAGRARPRTVVLEWIKPLYCGGYWQPELIQIAGGRPPADSAETFSWHQIREFAPEVVVVAPCNCSIDQARREIDHLEAMPGYWDLPAVKHGRVYLADGREYFRPGPRIVDTLELLAFAIHPDQFAQFCPNPSQAIVWM